MGFGCIGKMFVCDWDGIVLDMYILGKVLGGGVFLILCIVVDCDVLGVFNLGLYGFIFGGNLLVCVVFIVLLEVLEDEKLVDCFFEFGEYFKSEFESIDNFVIKEVCGRGLFIGVELMEVVCFYCECLKEEGFLCKEMYDIVICFVLLLIIFKKDLDWVIEKIKYVL